MSSTMFLMVMLVFITLIAFSLVIVFSPVVRNVYAALSPFLEDRKALLPYVDSKYKHAINCPFCEGTGTMVKVYFEAELGLANPAMAVPPQAFAPDDAPLDIYSQSSRIRKQEPCIYCKETGIAYAWYETIHKDPLHCEDCSGLGYTVEKRKLSIGVETNKIPCKACNGMGAIANADKVFVHVKSLAGRTRGSFDREEDSMTAYLAFYPTGPLSCRIKLAVDSTNQFLLKSRPRFDKRREPWVWQAWLAPHRVVALRKSCDESAH